MLTPRRWRIFIFSTHGFSEFGVGASSYILYQVAIILTVAILFICGPLHSIAQRSVFHCYRLASNTSHFGESWSTITSSGVLLQGACTSLWVSAPLQVWRACSWRSSDSLVKHAGVVSSIIRLRSSTGQIHCFRVCTDSSCTHAHHVPLCIGSIVVEAACDAIKCAVFKVAELSLRQRLVLAIYAQVFLMWLD